MEMSPDANGATVYQVPQEMTRMPHFWESSVNFLSLLFAYFIIGRGFSCRRRIPPDIASLLGMQIKVYE